MKKLISFMLLTSIATASFAQTITVLKKPHRHASNAFITQSIDNLISIYKSNEGWTKVGNKLTGDVGWIPTKMLEKNTSTNKKKMTSAKSHKQHKKSKKPLAKKNHINKATKRPINIHNKTFHLKHPHTATLHYSGTDDISQKQAEALLQQMEDEQKQFTNRMLRMEKDMQDFSKNMMTMHPGHHTHNKQCSCKSKHS